ncbi:hypothetical protein DFP72DRAFT_1077593 [Ephemerocybe angulata]|uniref:Uncharacterized protein n=1 Tax=Ephemerocybe angulata TaxID=980116 RepID=A0A8H6HFY8_9AGAR|nr:hypothetical protein DFP72DRAFT_1077593 [Tulosesus angulatus]
MAGFMPHRNMGVRLMGALAVAGGFLYYAKHRIAVQRKAELDQHRSGGQSSS